jgi:chemotaxis protein histidine kinase CheA
MSPGVATTASRTLADRLETPRRWLREIDRSGLADLGPVRAALEALLDEPIGPGLAEALRRIILLTEVCECLADGGSATAIEVSGFCDRALDDLGTALTDEQAVARSARIVEESSERWGQYLGLIDPAEPLPPDLSDPFAVEPVEEDCPSAIAPADLLRMLMGATEARQDDIGGSEPRPDPLPRGVGSSGAPPTLTPTLSQRERGPDQFLPLPLGEGRGEGAPDAESALTLTLSHKERGPDWLPLGAGQGEGAPGPKPDVEVPASDEDDATLTFPAIGAGMDPELREAFLAEAADLFERIESLVLGLGQGKPDGEALHELGRCFHTLKGASGSVGLVELSTLVHGLENGLEETGGGAAAELVNGLHDGLRQIERILDALRGGTTADLPASIEAGPGLGPEAAGRAVEATDPSPGRPSDAGSLTPSRRNPMAAAPSDATASEGPLRVPSAKIDVLMDLASELITRRGFWSTQAGGMREFAAQSRACRNRLLASIEQLHDLGLAREVPRGVAATPIVIDPDADLPGLVRRLSEQAEDLAALTEIARASTNLLADQSDALDRLTAQLWDALQAIRITPVRGLFLRLARVAHDAGRVEGRQVEVQMIGEEDGLDRAVQDKAMEPLLHVVRNAVGHGIEAPADRVNAGKPMTGHVTLEARREGNTMALSVADDGRGLDYAAIEAKGRRLGLLGAHEPAVVDRLNALIFEPGFSTREAANAISGRGVGMDVVAQEVARLQGTIDLTSEPGKGTRLTIRLPVRLALERAMIVRVDGQALALPVGLIDAVRPFVPGDRQGHGASAVVRVRDQTVRLIDVRDVLGFPAASPTSCPKLLLTHGDGGALGLLVDTIEGTRELVFRPLDPLLGGHPVFSGTSLLASGEVILALRPSGLARRLREAGSPASRSRREPVDRPAAVLVVDDSLSVRRVVTRQLRGFGLNVEEASDGLEALGKLRGRSFGMVLTDLEMPNLDGFDLLAELGRMGLLGSLPVVVASTKCDPETRRRVLGLGARAFVRKPVEPDDLSGVILPLLAGTGPETLFAGSP